MRERADQSQEAVIKAASDVPVMLYAGPGSGKSRTLIGRIAYLLRKKAAHPSQIIAVTFTNKAACELAERLETKLRPEEAEGLWKGTFHALAAHILRQHAPVVDRPVDFLICDEAMQENLVRLALNRCGYSGVSDWLLRRLLASFSACKRARHDPSECPGNHDVARRSSFGGRRADSAQDYFGERWADIAQDYQARLHEHRALDFDDLILYAARILYEEEAVRAAWHEAHPWLFIDEFHDIDEVQYQFVRLLHPSRERMMVVLDEQQQIYSWRGASAAIVKQFVGDYRPKRYDLMANYRSGPAIVAMCDALLGGKRQNHGNTADEGEVYRRWSLDEQAEGRWLVEEIQGLQRGGYKLNQIALLYRTHRIGEQLEAALVQGGLPLDRFQRRSFFERPEAQELRRYLQAAVQAGDEYLASALNFPRVVVDELTMIQLRQAAAARGHRLSEMMALVATSDLVGPATRIQLERFLHLVEEELVPLSRLPLRQATTRLFDIVEARRSPYLQETLETLRGFTHYLALSRLVEPLQRALAARQPIILLPDDTLDGWCAALLLAQVLEEYLGVRVPIERASSQPEGSFVIRCGTAGAGSLNVVAREAGSIRYPATLIAWQLAASLLVSLERAPTSRLVALDVETTGTKEWHDRIIEVAAQCLQGWSPVGPPFEQLVNPARPISQDATRVHGITEHDVRGAPRMEQVLPRYLAYLGDHVRLGHNPAFDLRFLRAEADRARLPFPTAPVLDTLPLARRLYPARRSYALEDLVKELALPPGGHHRALADVQHTVHLFKHLWEAHQQDQRLHLLTDYLPLVAGVLLAERNEKDENGLLVQAARRSLGSRGQSVQLHQALAMLPPDHERAARARQRELLQRPVMPSPDDDLWHDLRVQWQRHIEQFLRHQSGTASLDAFLSYTTLVHREADLGVEEDRVQVMTIHAAKGKEFRVVFLVGLEEGTLPMRHMADEAEERRVCYVGMSRARERLYLLGCQKREGQPRSPSRFWRALDAQFKA